MIRPLTGRRVRAICEALTARLAGELDIEDARREDYEAALEWAQEQRRRFVARQAIAKDRT